MCDPCFLEMLSFRINMYSVLLLNSNQSSAKTLGVEWVKINSTFCIIITFHILFVSIFLSAFTASFLTWCIFLRLLEPILASLSHFATPIWKRHKPNVCAGILLFWGLQPAAPVPHVVLLPLHFDSLGKEK